MRKSSTKTQKVETELNQNVPTSVEEVKEDGGNPSPKRKKILTATEVIATINDLKVPLGQARVVIEDVNEETEQLIEDLWKLSMVKFVVSGTDERKLNKLHQSIINRSNSLGRWRVVSPSQLRNEPAEVYVAYKERTDADIKTFPVKKYLNYKDF